MRGGLPGQPVQCLGYYTNQFTIIGGALYFAERLLREVRARRYTQISSVFLHPSGAMEIRFTKPSLKYKSGQWIFLQIPEISRFEWYDRHHGLRYGSADMSIFTGILSPYQAVHPIPTYPYTFVKLATSREPLDALWDAHLPWRS